MMLDGAANTWLGVKLLTEQKNQLSQMWYFLISGFIVLGESILEFLMHLTSTFCIIQ